jgi:hypothetical protein
MTHRCDVFPTALHHFTLSILGYQAKHLVFVTLTLPSEFYLIMLPVLTSLHQCLTSVARRWFNTGNITMEVPMSDEIKQEKEKTFEEIDAADLDEYLHGMQPGITCQIHRLEPAELSGFLEEVEVTEASNPISMEKLKRRWGGRKLLLKFRQAKGQPGGGRWLKFFTVAMYSYPPLVHGHPPTSDDIPNPHDQTTVNNIPTGDQNQLNQMTQFVSLMGVIQQMQKAETHAVMEVLKPLIERSMQPPPPPPTPPDPFKYFAQFGQMWSTVAEVVKHQIGGGQPVGENDELLAVVTKAIEAFKGDNNESRMKPPRLTADNPTVPSFGNNLAEGLSKLPATQAISTLQQAVSMMPKDQAAELMGALLSNIGSLTGKEQLLTILESQGLIESESDEDDDETPDDDGDTDPNPSPTDGTDD